MLKVAILALLFISNVKSDGDDGSSGHDLFNKYDINHDNHMGITEFRHLFMGFDAWPEDGRVSEHEFIAGWTAYHSELTEDRSTALFFLRTDLDHDGSVTASDVDKLFHMFDENGDNSVSDREFCDAFTAMYYHIKKC
ncbi:uncharacterized protein LOC117321886 [Pecten maximus]|uniref:uncharacterized protein LOC117321886 n=1 Tax=Pecten maximus TaxID=6579 RepID=UPI00145829E0|nr:uncharacterized protein LOC117321886 [Pecten maximus]